MSKMLQSASRILANNTLVRADAYINGKWIKMEKTFPVYCPSTNEVLAEVADIGKDEVTAAIDAASNAMEKWKSVNCKERAAMLHKFFTNVMNAREALAQIMTAECGKPIRETRVEVNYGASFLEWFAEEAKRINGDVLPSSNNTNRRFVFKQPVGVVGLVTPWNFPLAMITRKLGAAMAAGCTSVIKPSEETPLTALALAAIADDTGIPPGVVNVLPCSRANTQIVGEAICQSPVIKKISFTGSTATGKLLLKQSSDTVKRVSLELGGNAPFIVFDSANMEHVLKSAMVAKFRGNGQTCIAGNRFLVQKGIYDRFLDEVTRAVENVAVGDPFDDDTALSSLVNKMQVSKVEAHVRDAIKKGCDAVIGCDKHPLGPNFYRPTILAGCTKDMLVMTDETFGPVMSVMKFETEQEAIDIANSSKSGLAGYMFSQDVSQIFRVSEKMEVGMVGVNESAISSEMIPFGGVKESGIGREGAQCGIDEYLDMKYVCLGGL